MAISANVTRVRGALGPVGAFVGMLGPGPHVDEQCTGVQRLEGAGYRAVWTNEVIGGDALVRASLWLAATEQVVVGTCIANMWARPAQTAHAAATQIGQAYPGRFVLGLGVGHPQQAAAVGRDFGAPVATARAYLEQATNPDYPRILAANGPRMLATAGEFADGALPAGAPPEFTAQARAALGPDGLLVVYLPDQEADTPATVREAVDRHLGAGADHVVIGRSSGTGFAGAVDRLLHLAPTLTAYPG